MYISTILGKTALRTEISARRSLAVVQKSHAREASYKILELVNAEESAQMRKIKCVALYQSQKQEPPTHDAINALLERSIRVIVPQSTKLSADGFYEVLSDGSLGTAVDISEVDLIIVPALVVSLDGVRLGYGGGWYDRQLVGRSSHTKVFALVYADEVYPAGQLPCEPHDVMVDDYISISSV